MNHARNTGTRLSSHPCVARWRSNASPYLAILLPLLLMWLPLSTQASTREVTSPAVVEAPTIDGALDDACWKEAAGLSLDHVVGSEARPKVGTRVLLTHDNRFLYIGVRCQEDGTRDVLARHRGRDNRSTTYDDSIEIFLDTQPAEHRHRYWHFMLGAGGAKREQYVHGDSMYPHHTVPWPSAVRADKKGWTAEVAIPIFALGQTRVGRTGMNITRNRHTDPTSFMSWVPLSGKNRAAYYAPDAFGRLRGLEGIEIEPVFAPLLVEAGKVTPYTTREGQTSYGFGVTLKECGGKPGEVTVVVEDRDARADKVTRHEAVFALDAHEAREVEVDVPVEEPGPRTARTALTSAQERDAAWVEVRGMGALKSLTLYPDLNVYSGESTGRLTVGTVYTDAGFAARGLKLLVRVAAEGNETPVLEKRFAKTRSQGVVVPFEPDTWKPGRYRAAAELSDGEGNVLATRTCRLRVEPPPPEGITVTKVDQERICILANGEPFFPLGFLALPDFGDVDVIDEATRTVKTEDLARRCAQGGFNTLVSWGRVPSRTGRTRTRADVPWTEETDRLVAKDIRAFIEKFKHVRDAGLFVVPQLLSHITIGFNNQTINRKDHALVMEKLPTVISAYRHVPNMVFLMGRDEVSPSILDITIKHADVMRRVDPYHVIWASARGCHEDFFEAYDVFGNHGYWGPDSTPNHLATRIQALVQTAKCRRRPGLATPQGQRTQYRRELTPAERRAGLYLPVIQGAKGILFFQYPHAMEAVHPVTWRVLCYTAGELNILAPILLNQPPPQNVECTVSDKPGPAELPALPPPRTLFDPSWDAKPPDRSSLPVVQALIHDRPGGGEIVLLANSSADGLRASLALSSLGPDTRVSGYFDGQEYPVREGRIDDVLEPYAVRVYEITGSMRGQGDPVGLGIRATAGATRRRIEHYSPKDRRVDMGGYEKKVSDYIWSPVNDEAQAALNTRAAERNLLTNTSFEEYALPMLPDNWMHSYIMRDLCQRFWGQDDTQAYEGQYSIRLKPESKGRRFFYPMIVHRYWSDWEPGRDYVFSAWVKANHPDTVVRLSVTPARRIYNEAQGLFKDFTVGVEWQRVAWTFRLPEKGVLHQGWRRLLCPGFRNAGCAEAEDSCIWIDAVQLEAGTTPTPYERDRYEAPEVDVKWLTDEVFRALEPRKTGVMHPQYQERET